MNRWLLGLFHFLFLISSSFRPPFSYTSFRNSFQALHWLYAFSSLPLFFFVVNMWMRRFAALSFKKRKEKLWITIPHTIVILITSSRNDDLPLFTPTHPLFLCVLVFSPTFSGFNQLYSSSQQNGRAFSHSDIFVYRHSISACAPLSHFGFTPIQLSSSPFIQLLFIYFNSLFSNALLSSAKIPGFLFPCSLNLLLVFHFSSRFKSFQLFFFFNFKTFSQKIISAFLWFTLFYFLSVNIFLCFFRLVSASWNIHVLFSTLYL